MFTSFVLCSIGLQGGESVELYRFEGQSMWDRYGNAVAGIGDVDADGVPDFMYSATNEDPGGLESAGSVFVHSGRTGALIYRIDGGSAFAFIGSSLSGAGDVNGDGVEDFMIGANWDQNFAGVASVYSGASGNLLYSFHGQNPSDNIGIAMDHAGDVNGDGFADVILGSPSSTHNDLLQSGGVQVFSGFDGSLIHKIGGTVKKGHFGASVAGVGDLNGDGFDDFAVGTGSYSQIYVRSGSFSVFSGLDASLLYSHGGRRSDWMGSAVARAGDVDGDGTPDILVGAAGSNNYGPYGGAAFIVSGATFRPILLMHEDVRETSARFGTSLASVGDADGDGIPDVIVGADYSELNSLEPGSAFLISGSTGALLHAWEGETADSYFGRSVDGVGDLDGDGLGDVIISDVFSRPNGLLWAGMAHVFAFHPFLTANTHALSASVGGVITLNHSFPIASAGYEYKTLLSATGNRPSLYGIEIPLSFDSVMRQSFMGTYPFSGQSGMHGVLDSSAEASATMNFAGGMPPGFVGQSFWVAAVANQPGQLPKFSSVAVQIEITP